MEVITSSENNQIKLIQKLKMKKYRVHYGKYLLEGFKLVDEAVQFSHQLVSIFISEALQNDERIVMYLTITHCEVYFVEEHLFTKLSNTSNSQGIMAICTVKKVKHIDNGKRHILILDRIQDPGNLGTMIRTADAAGFNLVVCGEGCVDLYNPKTIRSTMGSIFHIDIIQDINLVQYIKELYYDYCIVGTSLDTKNYYNDLKQISQYALLIGNEGDGVRKELLELCHEIVKIPIYGKAESLNASVAASIIMYYIASLV